MYQALDQDAQQKITGAASQYEKQYQVLSSFAAGKTSETVLNQTILTIKSRPVRRAFEAARDNLKGLVSDVEFKRFANKAGQQRLERMMLATSPAAVPSNYVAALFSSSEPGTWYDPSDLTTLYQDSAGTTPVTAVEQPVGLMLDKSKGLVLGSELVTNASIAGLPAGGGTRFYPVSMSSVAAGKVYKITFTVSNYSGTGTVGLAGAAPAGVTQINCSGNGTYTCVQFPTSSGLLNFYTLNTNTADFSFISVRELPGNHAFQTTTTSRPVLSARYNLLTYSQDFDNAAWGKTRATVVANAAVAPDGTTTAEKLVEDTTATSTHTTAQTVSVVNGSVYTYSVFLKAGERTYAGIYASTPGQGVVFNLSTGAYLGNLVAAPTGYSITSAGNGWYRCSITYTATSSSTAPSIYVCDNTGAFSYTGDGTSGIYIWGASLVPSNQASLPYQRVNTATDYDTVGFKPYLKFDGVDDFLQTNSIDFTSTDKMHVCAGVRKLSDAAAGMVAELSSGAGGGRFYVVVSNPSGNANYETQSTGSASATAATANSFASPITNVLSAISIISAPSSTLRVNGTQAAQSTATQGTGNYGNYPLYIGRRGGTTLPFNGQLYSLVIRGSASTDAQIAATERFVAGKTGVTW